MIYFVLAFDLLAVGFYLACRFLEFMVKSGRWR